MLITAAYSAFLRVCEVVSINIYKIDSTRMTILISRAKDKKDRIVSLNPVLLALHLPPGVLRVRFKQLPSLMPIIAGYLIL